MIRFTVMMAAAALSALLVAGCNKPSVEAEQAKQQGMAFLAENASKPGVVKTASG